MRWRAHATAATTRLVIGVEPAPPTAGKSVASIASEHVAEDKAVALDGLADLQSIGGISEKLRIDHGLEFCADAVRAAAAVLDVDCSARIQFRIVWLEALRASAT